MKRIFTLFLTMLTALCASASDYTFKVEVQGQEITVTPSAETGKFLVAIFDPEAIELCKQKGLPLETDQQMVDAALNIKVNAWYMNMSEPFTQFQMPDGEYTVVMAAYKSVTSDNIENIQVEKVTINVVPEDDVTFEFSCTGETCTITPSNNESEYAAFILAPAGADMLPNVSYWAVGKASALKIGEARTGKSEITTADVDMGFEINLNDRCVVVVFGVKTFMKSLKDGDFETYSNSTPFSYFVWNVGETTTAIDTIETPASSMGKTFKDGKFIINGNVLIDGTLVK